MEKLERTKQRYEARLKKMEQQILQSMLFPTQFSAAAASSGLGQVRLERPNRCPIYFYKTKLKNGGLVVRQLKYL